VVDQAFLDFAPVALMRVTQGVLTESGGFPHARFANARVERADAENVHFHVGGRKNVKQIPGGSNVSFEGRRMTPKYTAQVTRFLFKAALEFTYVDQGRESHSTRSSTSSGRSCEGGHISGHIRGTWGCSAALSPMRWLRSPTGRYSWTAERPSSRLLTFSASR
jgi:hypothetical protein